jgi:hypothetical protein
MIENQETNIILFIQWRRRRRRRINIANKIIFILFVHSTMRFRFVLLFYFAKSKKYGLLFI